MRRGNTTKNCGCRGRSGEVKRKFGTRNAAVQQAYRMPGFPRPYPCPKVKNRWHLTHA